MFYCILYYIFRENKSVLLAVFVKNCVKNLFTAVFFNPPVDFSSRRSYNKTMDTQKTVLGILLGQKNEYVSGEEIAGKLSVTRMAVSRAVALLRDEGYEIASKNNRGYMLINDDRVIYADKIEKATGLKTEYFSSLPSTNDRAKVMAAEKSGSAVIIAKRQTAGRARHEKDFYSLSDGAYFTALIKKKIPLGSAEKLAAGAVKKVAALCGGEQRENTVYKNGRKLCGVLSESVSDMDFVEYSIVGVGVYPDPALPPRTELIISVVSAVLEAAKALAIEE